MRASELASGGGLVMVVVVVAVEVESVYDVVYKSHEASLFVAG